MIYCAECDELITSDNAGTYVKLCAGCEDAAHQTLNDAMAQDLR
jgi:hypothetical protein